MTKKVTADEFEGAMTDLLQEYLEDVYGIVSETSKDLGKQALNMVKARSPKNTGAYAAGWQKDNRGSQLDNYYYVRIRNKTRYRLTHLLNFGHHWKNYGKVWNRTYKGDNHITETELEFKEKYANQLRTKIGRK